MAELFAGLQMALAASLIALGRFGEREVSVRDHIVNLPLAKPTLPSPQVMEAGCSKSHACSYLSPAQLGLLLREHLVAEVIGLDSEIVFPPHSLVT